jgi:3-hydroxyisobutyrate dehydrogenase
VDSVGFCGLGLMGAPMAARLLHAGFEVRVWNRTAAACDPLAAQGAAVASSPAEAAAGAGLVITMLADAAAVEAVVTGPGGIAADGIAAAAPPVLAQMSTVSPAQVRHLATLLPPGTRLLDTPVLGSVPQASDGSLRILAGGDAGTLERCREPLGALGEVALIGPLGAASALKLVTNAAVAPMVALLAEALALGTALGLDQGLLLDELARGRLGPLVERKRAKIERGSYEADSTLRLFTKDMRLVLQAGDESGVALRMAAAAEALAAEAERSGRGAEDYSVLVDQVRRLVP